VASSFELVNTALSGKLEKRLRHMRSLGLSFDDMTAEFAAEGIAVSRETVRRWCKETAIETSRVGAAK